MFLLYNKNVVSSNSMGNFVDSFNVMRKFFTIDNIPIFVCIKPNRKPKKTVEYFIIRQINCQYM